MVVFRDPERSVLNVREHRKRGKPPFAGRYGRHIMRILIFGATGMVGQGALRECLRDRRVTDIVSIVRTPSGISAPELHEIVMPDLAIIRSQAPRLTGFDACLFCLGVSALGMSEADYTAV